MELPCATGLLRHGTPENVGVYRDVTISSLLGFHLSHIPSVLKRDVVPALDSTNIDSVSLKSVQTGNNGSQTHTSSIIGKYL